MRSWTACANHGPSRGLGTLVDTHALLPGQANWWKPRGNGLGNASVHLVPPHRLHLFLTHPNNLPLLKEIQERCDRRHSVRELVKSTTGNVARLREAVRYFRNQLGHWPSTTALGAALFAKKTDSAWLTATDIEDGD